MWPFTKAADESVLEMRKGYHTSVAYMDMQLGKVLAALEASRFRDRTIVVFMSDHGWSLGERGMFCKQSNFDLVARVPLMVKVPWLKS